MPDWLQWHKHEFKAHVAAAVRMSLDVPCDWKDETDSKTTCSYIRCVISVGKWAIRAPHSCSVCTDKKADLETQDLPSNTAFFCMLYPFHKFSPLSLYRRSRLSWRDRGEIHVPGRVFVSNRSASAVVVAGTSITSVVPFLPCIDQLPQLS